MKHRRVKLKRKLRVVDFVGPPWFPNVESTANWRPSDSPEVTHIFIEETREQTRLSMEGRGITNHANWINWLETIPFGSIYIAIEKPL